MRFRLGPIPISSQFREFDPWMPLREATPWRAWFYAMPFAILNFLILGLPWFLFDSINEESLRVSFHHWPIWRAFLGLVLLHEVCHLLMHPRRGFSRQTIVGFWPSRTLIYVHYDGEKTRNTAICILLTPLLLLSAAPLVLASLCKEAIPLVASLAIANAFVSCLDVYEAALIMSQVPNGAIVRNQGWRTYWRR